MVVEITFPRRSIARNSHHGADLPRHEFKIAVAELLGLGPFARRYRQDLFEDLLALFGDRHTVDDVAAIDIHVIAHRAKDLGIGGELERGRRLAAERRAAPRGEAHDVAAARHLAGRADRIVAGSVHEHEALL